jgi:hypothetical protein
MSNNISGDRKQLVKVALRINTQANSENDKFGIDPLTVITIVNLILTLIKLLNRCRSEARVNKTIRRPGPIVRLLMRRQIAKEYPSSERKAVYNAVLKESKEMSDEELDGIINYYKEMERKE